MAAARRPPAERVEIGAPGLAALAARTFGHLPEPLRGLALRAEFDRARDAFNRGDLEAVFALFDPEVEYGPPPPLHRGDLLQGRPAVLDFWRGALARYGESAIENLSLEEAAPGRIVRRARLRHLCGPGGPGGEALSYAIVQTTELDRGLVVRQINALDPKSEGQITGP